MGNDDPKPQVKIATPARPIEIKTYVMSCQTKMTLYRNKKVNEINKKKAEAIAALKQNNLDIAKAKMESIIRLEDQIIVYDILSPLCEILKERITYICSSSEPPPDIRAPLDTIIYASTRLEIDDLYKLRHLVKKKYGTYYVDSAGQNKDGLVNVNVVEKLKVKPPIEAFLTIRLKQLCKEKRINYEFPEEIAPNFDQGNPYGGGMGNPYDNNFGGNGGGNNPYGPNNFVNNPYGNGNNNMNNMGGNDFDSYMKNSHSGGGMGNNMGGNPYENNYNNFGGNNMGGNPYDNNNFGGNNNMGGNPYDNNFNNNSKMGNSKIGGSKIGNSKMGNSKMGNSKIGNSKIGNSKIGNSKIGETPYGGTGNNFNGNNNFEDPFNDNNMGGNPYGDNNNSDPFNDQNLFNNDNNLGGSQFGNNNLGGSKLRSGNPGGSRIEGSQIGKGNINSSNIGKSKIAGSK